MTPDILESISTWLVDWSLVTVMDNTTPPRDPNDENDEDDEDDKETPRARSGSICSSAGGPGRPRLSSTVTRCLTARFARASAPLSTPAFSTSQQL
jgi:hypothetical protein